MLVIHGLWPGGGELCVWAEDSQRYGGTAEQVGRMPVPHPYAAPTDALCAALDLAGRPGVRALLLPVRADTPLPSQELIVPGDGAQEPTGTAAFSVPVLELGADDALWLLDRLDRFDRTDPAGMAACGLALGGSLRWLIALAAFGVDVAERGLVVPSLQLREDHAEARWAPVLADDDLLRARQLAEAIPPVAHAEYWSRHAGVGGGWIAPTLLAICDAAVRRALDRHAGADAPFAFLPPRRSSTPPPVEERWLDALAGAADSGQVSVDGPGSALESLADKLQSWLRVRTPDAAVRLCFRLDLPPDDGPFWIEFLLQSIADPSLTITARELWDHAGAYELFTALTDDPAQTLLTGLARARRVYPVLTTAMRDTHPVGLSIDADRAHRFLRQGAPVLANLGFGVLIPRELERPGQLGMRLRVGSPATPSTGQVGLEAIVDYQLQLMVDGAHLSGAELKALVAAKRSLVRMRGRWVEFDPKTLQAAIDLVDRRGEGTMTLAELLAAERIDGLIPGPVEIDADGFVGKLLAGDSAALDPVPTPVGLTATLRPYQERGLAWLVFLTRAGLGGCLADDMGLGKTVQLLALLAAERDPRISKVRVGPTLVVAPMSVVGNWQREATRFTPELEVYVHHGADRLGGARLAQAAAQADLVLTTYGLAARDVEALRPINWYRIVVDEAQNIKNPGAAQSKAVRSLPARHHVALTGTPVENRLSELWSIMDFANPGVLGTATQFHHTMAVPIEREGDEAAVRRLRRRTGPFILRRLKTDPAIVSELPEKLEMKVMCNLTEEQATLYGAIVEDMLAQIADARGIGRRGLVLATLTKLKQVCNHPAHFLGDGSALPGRSGKLARLVEILEEVLSEGDRALCFTQFAEFGEMMRAYLAGRFGTEVLFLHGGLSRRARDAMVDRFQSGDGPSIFVLSLKAGGLGLNLTAANHVIHVDRWWNPAVEQQATDRAFRIGQHRNVQVRKFICTGTVEERIDAMIDRKQQLAETVIGSGEDWLTDLDTASLRELFALGEDAVSEIGRLA